MPTIAPPRPLPLVADHPPELAAATTRFAFGRVAICALVVALAAFALVIRVAPLDRPDGALDTDEARLGLAADGVLATGLPILPSGRFYGRGLLTTYAIAPSFALFGRHDWSARLPSALAGALLVPVVFVFGRQLAGATVGFGTAAGPATAGGLGTAAGLGAAALVAVAEPLVDWSGRAWPPAFFVLCFVAAAYATYRGFGQDEARWQPRAAGLFALALLAYEFALLLPLALGPYLLIRLLRGDRDWWRWRATLVALGTAAVAVAAFIGLGLALRAGTLAGADAEFRHYFSPGLRLEGARFYLERVWGPYLPLLALVVAGLPWTLGPGRRVVATRVGLSDAGVSGGHGDAAALAGSPADSATMRRASPDAEARPASSAAPGLVLLLLLMAVVVPAFGIQRKWEEHYGLVVLPLLGLAAAQGAAGLAGPLARALPSPRWLGRALAAGMLGAVLLLSVRDDLRALARPIPPVSGPTWLDELRSLGWQPGDLLLVEAPLVTQFFLGAADFYVHPEGYERYARPDGPVARSLYTNAVLLKEPGDFERLVARQHAGRVLWIVGKDDRLPRLTREMEPAVWSWLQERSRVRRPTRTGWWLMRVELPR